MDEERSGKKSYGATEKWNISFLILTSEYLNKPLKPDHFHNHVSGKSLFCANLMVTLSLLSEESIRVMKGELGAKH